MISWKEVSSDITDKRLVKRFQSSTDEMFKIVVLHDDNEIYFLFYKLKKNAWWSYNLPLNLMPYFIEMMTEINKSYKLRNFK